MKPIAWVILAAAGREVFLCAGFILQSLISVTNLTGHHGYPAGYPWLSHPHGAPRAALSTFGCSSRILEVFSLWCGISWLTLSLCAGKAYYQCSAYFSFRNISQVIFVYDCGITEISNEKMSGFIKILSAWTRPIRENYQYYVTLLCHTKWFASQLLKNIWVPERVTVGHCGLTYSNRNVWGCCRFVTLFAKNKYISLHIWNF